MNVYDFKCEINNHKWIYTSDNTFGYIPEGTPCVCGEMIAHYEICSECGNEALKPRRMEGT